MSRGESIGCQAEPARTGYQRPRIRPALPMARRLLVEQDQADGRHDRPTDGETDTVRRGRNNGNGQEAKTRDDDEKGPAMLTQECAEVESGHPAGEHHDADDDEQKAKGDRSTAPLGRHGLHGTSSIGESNERAVRSSTPSAHSARLSTRRRRPSASSTAQSSG